jgi:ribosome-binding protein aMBF1 (putative translation factor)
MMSRNEASLFGPMHDRKSEPHAGYSCTLPERVRTVPTPLPTSSRETPISRRIRIPYEGIARFVIMRRAELGLTQEQLAERMGTSHSAISRVESGRHRASVATLERLAQALEVRFVIGFETGPVEAPVRELVSL